MKYLFLKYSKFINISAEVRRLIGFLSLYPFSRLSFCHDTINIQVQLFTLHNQLGGVKNIVKILSTQIKELKEIKDLRIEVVNARFDTFKSWFQIFIGIFILIIGANCFSTNSTAKAAARQTAENEIVGNRRDYDTIKGQMDIEIFNHLTKMKRMEASIKIKNKES